MTGADWIAGLVAAYGGRPSGYRTHEQGQRERGDDIPAMPDEMLHRERSQLLILLAFLDVFHPDVEWYERRRAMIETELGRRSRTPARAHR